LRQLASDLALTRVIHKPNIPGPSLSRFRDEGLSDFSPRQVDAMQRLGFQIWRVRQAGSVSKLLRNFVRDEGGLVSLEWVAIAALVAVGAIAITGVVMVGLAPPAKNICLQLGATAAQCNPP
jgi:Flp pilus assembly pilin Flp